MQFALKLPLLGFESVKQMELKKIDDIFMRLESVGEGPSFTLVNPFVLREYSFDIPSSLQALMEINPESNLLIYNIMIIQSPIENSTVNFVAPIIFNTDNQTMAQIIIDNRNDFSIAEPIKNYLKGSENG
ncbi:flagellar assembly protein FliW [Sulfuricurvum sp. IAE1]|jgi:flagellar assembly factor FliW|uniref:flagellar assembly protein FliW n=1 Tax=Sulfuricurvum sp. IAE1 TaxID=2546102 RepID=UPI00105386D4|nr:flagellar assembly protein FliW [Sulfuricurvum sp. IAE1]MDD3769547.1 flagellar assembly protein FliW [Sulfuricurvum sp.]MDX9965393.1 flagellar assembly protein FliW [Sulfuricurvum sp.]TDA62781.1 flagellar assembly protein FliW [Sulfuricurvum sp. IAE1]